MNKQDQIRNVQQELQKATANVMKLTEEVTKATAEEQAVATKLARLLCPFKVGDIIPLCMTYMYATHAQIVDITPGDYFSEKYRLILAPINKKGKLMKNRTWTGDAYTDLTPELEKLCGKVSIDIPE